MSLFKSTKAPVLRIYRRPHLRSMRKEKIKRRKRKGNASPSLKKATLQKHRMPVITGKTTATQVTSQTTRTSLRGKSSTCLILKNLKIIPTWRIWLTSERQRFTITKLSQSSACLQAMAKLRLAVIKSTIGSSTCPKTSARLKSPLSATSTKCTQ